MEILKLLFILVMSIVVSIILYKFVPFKKFKHEQIIIGVIFGFMIMIDNFFSSYIHGVLVNISTSLVLCAGLIFGTPAGIIAGVIGGIHKCLTMSQGIGMYSQVIEGLVTILVGFCAAGLRIYMFNHKKPTWSKGIFIVIIIEVIHVLIIFTTHVFEMREIFLAITIDIFSQIILNSIVVGISLKILSLIVIEAKTIESEKRNISQVFHKGVFICLFIAFIATASFNWWTVTEISKTDTSKLLEVNIKDIEQDFLEALNSNTIYTAKTISNNLLGRDEITNDYLIKQARAFNLTEINIINKDGIIVNSTNEKQINFDMSTKEYSKEFLVLLDGKTKEFIQEDHSNAIYDDSYRMYVGVSLASGGFLQIGYDYDRFQLEISYVAKHITNNRHIGQNGYPVIADMNYKIISSISAPDEILQFEVEHDLIDIGECEKFSLNMFNEPYRNGDITYTVSV
ncbi:hypothetical protein AN640_07030 [Candidatus Epulonipiscium fishelsonii]|uniref:Uncharacterized protein n=1 Tax=Candidatus Epulonipiscium fishelsonii TaxID=77094 RepID=A0ACC8XGS6_9FIRM|nr:hypothetical protein AN640_07030 [Epulopiscium sp. SCG-D08WGA-EpuloA1]OON97037.1 MAG: hypothetical protein ATN32_00770 [Epulopiscium sp. AS2M-Bin002]